MTQTTTDRIKGDAAAFDRNWREREETYYTHWCRGEVRNQIQLAFRSHWQLFQEIMGENFKGRRVLEVGCGRGSMSAYFADAGWDATLLDLSPAVIETAKGIFNHRELKAKFVVGDALNLPFPENSFDVAVSIGLLEHFEDIRPVISEQIRTLAPGGLFLGYVVPHRPDNIQKDYSWINELLKIYVPPERLKKSLAKAPVYRSDDDSKKYIECLKALPTRDVSVSGVYPLPMISYSPDFPFSLLEPEAEYVLVKEFSKILEERKRTTGKNPWLCDESYGQAFLVWAFKK